MDLAKLNRLRSKAQRLSRERFALIVFSQAMTRELRQRLKLDEEEIKRSSMTKLRQFIDGLEAEVLEIRQLMGAKEASSELVRVLSDAESAPGGKSLLITKRDKETVQQL